MKKLRVQRLTDSAVIPTYGSEGAACFDLYADDTIAINGDGASVIPTGLAFEVPDNHVMLVFSRSGHGFKNGVRLSNCTGVIDSDYRGEVKVALRNDSKMMYVVNKGERIAQALLFPVARYEFIDAEKLSDTARGQAGFGSTGK